MFDLWYRPRALPCHYLPAPRRRRFDCLIKNRTRKAPLKFPHWSLRWHEWISLLCCVTCGLSSAVGLGDPFDLSRLFGTLFCLCLLRGTIPRARVLVAKLGYSRDAGGPKGPKTEAEMR